MVEPTLAFLDLEYCDRILKCLKEAEVDGVGVFQTDLWKHYRHKHLTKEIQPEEGFKFDEQFTNMYRSGVPDFYARSDFNKFSS